MNLIDKMPSFFNNSIDTVIQNALQIEADTINEEAKSTLDQFFVDSCTWGLDNWEKMLGIPKNNFDLITRRENIKAKMRSRGTSTIAVIKNICESYSNGEVEIIEDNANYSFTIKFIGTLGIPKAFEELDRTINEIKPCHLAHNYAFTYMSWEAFDKYNYTWEKWDTLKLTWDEFETYNGENNKEGSVLDAKSS